MKRGLHILFFFALCVRPGLAQDWSSCGQPGFFYTPMQLYSDTVDNKLYVSGFNTTINSINYHNIATWDGVSWDSLGQGLQGNTGGLLIRYKNKIYSQKDDRIYTWDLINHTWDSVPGSIIENDGYIYSACVFNNDLILVGGFGKIGSVSANSIVRFDGTNFFAVGAAPPAYYFRTVAVYHNEIYVGGNFGSDTIHSAIAKWDGSQWQGVNYGFRGGGPPEVVSLKVYHNRLFAGGAFYGTIDKYMPSLAAWDGVKWNSVGGIYNANYPWGVVSTMFELNHKLIVAGGFDRAGDINVSNMAVWNDTNWCSINATFPGMIILAAGFQNTIYVSGFYKIGADSTRLLGYYVGNNLYGACGAPLTVNEIKISDNIKIYPNPTASILNIWDEQNELQNATIEITNSIGQSVMSLPFKNSIDVSGLSTGCYFINMTTQQNQVLHSKFIKE